MDVDESSVRAKTPDKQEVLREARERLRQANKAYQRALAAVHPLLDMTEVTVHQRRLKRFDRVRRCSDPAPMVRLASAFREQVKLLRSLMPNPEMPVLGPSAMNVIHVDADPEAVDELAVRKWFVDRALQGGTYEDILADLGLERSLSWAKRIMKKYRQGGYTGLVDGRKSRRSRAKTVMTDEVLNEMVRLYFHHPYATERWIAKTLATFCRKNGLRVPSRETVRRALGELPAHEKALRQGHESDPKAVWRAKASPTTEIPTVTPNEEWQADEADLEVWVRAGDTGNVVPSRVRIVAMLDTHSRVIAGFQVRLHAFAQRDVTAVLKDATTMEAGLVPECGGVPRKLRTDNGAAFTGSHSAKALANLGIEHIRNPPNYPNRNGKIERFFRTMKQDFSRSKPYSVAAIGKSKEAAQGHIEKLPTLAQVLEDLRCWIREYNDGTHPIRPGVSRLGVWKAEVKIRSISATALIGLEKLCQQTRKVQRNGITHAKQVYGNPALYDSIGRTVRYSVGDDGTSLRVYSIDFRYLCEAYLPGTHGYTGEIVRDTYAAASHEASKRRNEIRSQSAAPDLPSDDETGQFQILLDEATAIDESTCSEDQICIAAEELRQEELEGYNT